VDAEVEEKFQAFAELTGLFRSVVNDDGCLWKPFFEFAFPVLEDGQGNSDKEGAGDLLGEHHLSDKCDCLDCLAQPHLVSQDDVFLTVPGLH